MRPVHARKEQTTSIGAWIKVQNCIDFHRVGNDSISRDSIARTLHLLHCHETFKWLQPQRDINSECPDLTSLLQANQLLITSHSSQVLFKTVISLTSLLSLPTTELPAFFSSKFNRLLNQRVIDCTSPASVRGFFCLISYIIALQRGIWVILQYSELVFTNMFTGMPSNFTSVVRVAWVLTISYSMCSSHGIFMLHLSQPAWYNSQAI